MAAKKKDSGKFIQAATKKMAEKGTKGSFTKAAKKAGKSVSGEISSVLKPGSKATPKMKKKAAFAKAMKKIASRKKAKA